MIVVSVVSHSYGGFGGSRDGRDGWQACETKLGVVDHVLENSGALPECEVKTLMTSD